MKILSLIWIFLCTYTLHALHRDYFFVDKNNQLSDVNYLDNNNDYSELYDYRYCIDHFQFTRLDYLVLTKLPSIEKKLLYLLPPSEFNLECCYKNCSKLTNYSGYLDPDFHKFNPFLEEQLNHYASDQTCTCYWPEYSKKAAAINNLAYSLFYDLFKETALSSLSSRCGRFYAVNREPEKLLQQEKLIGNQYWRLNHHGLTIALVCQSFWFSHYYRICDMILDFSTKEECYSYEQKNYIKIKLDNILLILANEFNRLYVDCLYSHPSQVILQEQAFLQGLLNLISQDEQMLNIKLQTEKNESYLQESQTHILFESTKIKGDKIENAACIFYPQTKCSLTNSTFLSDFYLIQGLFYNDLLIYQTAIDCFTKSIKIHGQNKKAYLARAYAYFEMGEIDLALNDFRKVKSFNNSDTSLLPLYASHTNHTNNFRAKFELMEYTKGFSLGFMEGFNVGSREFLPSLLHSITGISQGLWYVIKNPITFSSEFIYTLNLSIQYLKEHINIDELADAAPEFKELLINFAKFNDFEKGRKAGYVIGKYGIDIFACAGTMKAVNYYRELKYANASLTLDICNQSSEYKTLILKEAKQRASFRKSLYKDGKIKIHWGKQEKHIVGSNNYLPGKSKINLSREKLEAILSEKVGTGQAIPPQVMGTAGYKERIDFGEIIGECIYETELGIKIQEPTTIGIVCYDAKGYFHMVPARPTNCKIINGK